MLDPILRAPAQRLVAPWSGKLQAGGLRANTLTVIAFVLGLIGCFAAGMQVYPLALVLIALNRLADAMAGSIANRTGITPLGCYIDAVCDFVLFGAFVFFFSLGASGTSLAAAALVFSYLALAVCYFAQLAFGRGPAAATPKDGFVGNAEITVFMLACCLFPPAFPVLATLFAILCAAAAGYRGIRAIKSLPGLPEPQPMPGEPMPGDGRL